MMPRISIRTKIVVPFLALFAVEFAVVAALSASVAARSVEQSIRRETGDLARVLGRSGFAPDRDMLRKIKAIVGMDVARFEGAPGALISTLDERDERELEGLLAHVIGQASAPPPAAGGGELDAALPSGSWRVFHWPVETALSSRGTTFVMMMPSERIRARQVEIVRPILAFAGAGAAVVAALGVLLAITITRPVAALAEAARRLAAGSLDERVAEAGSDELGELARSFNHMAAEIQRREAELVRSERLAVSGRLAAGVAHEVRNPLTAVRMTLQRAARPDAPPLEGATAGILLTEIQRVEMIVDGLLVYARPGPPQLSPADLCGLVRDVLRLMERQLEHAHVAATADLPAGGVSAVVDGAKLRQVVMNLVLNALQAMPGGGTLGVRAAREGELAVIEVSDTGRGIPDSVRARLFEPFVSSREGGTGLGLAVSKQIVEEHAGSIGFESSPGRTVFRVELPAGGPKR